jgi:hypothetical protein
MPNKSSNVKNEKQYEALKDKGMSKERAAKIANSKGSSSRGGKSSGSGSSKSNSSQVTSPFVKTPSRARSLATHRTSLVLQSMSATLQRTNRSMLHSTARTLIG